MAEDRKDRASNAQNYGFGAGKDVLFGWLVGRAAADLGLAQAIAASEEQRNEQLKRFEESLLHQMQELHKQQDVTHEFVLSPEIEVLKAEIQNFTARVVSLEAETQQAHQLGDTLKAGFAAVENQLADHQSRIESGHMNFEQLECSIIAKVREIEEQFRGAPANREMVAAEIVEIRSQFQNLIERVICCESATSSALSRAELETERWRWTSEVDERFMARVRELGDEIREKLSAIKLDHESSAAELAQLIQRFMRIESESRCGTAELRAELGAHREASRNRESDRKANEALLKEQIARLDQAVSSLESNVREQAAAAAAKHARQWDEFVARVDALAATRVNDVTSAADLSGWKDELEKSLAPRFAAVEAVLNEQRRHAELNAGTGDSLTLQMHALTERIANLEIASQGFQALGSEGRRQTEQVAEALKTDLASFKAEVTAQLQMLPTPDQSLKTIEDKFALKLDALQAQILQTQLASEDYGRQFLGLRSEIQTLVQRLSETESATQQTHALMVNECGQEAQWRDGLRSEHESLRAQVAAIQPNDNALRALEEGFQREIGALEDRLIQKWRLLEQQDADLRELKAQFQNFAQQSNPADAVLPVSPVTPFAPTVAVPVDISALRAQREASSVGSIKAQPQSVVVGPVDNQEPSETLSNVNRDQLKQLQERLSADIERARNELREKSGRWKVRR